MRGAGRQPDSSGRKCIGAAQKCLVCRRDECVGRVAVPFGAVQRIVRRRRGNGRRGDGRRGNRQCHGGCAGRRCGRRNGGFRAWRRRQHSNSIAPAAATVNAKAPAPRKRLHRESACRESARRKACRFGMEVEISRTAPGCRWQDHQASILPSGSTPMFKPRIEPALRFAAAAHCVGCAACDDNARFPAPEAAAPGQ